MASKAPAPSKQEIVTPTRLANLRKAVKEVKPLPSKDFNNADPR